MMFLRSALPVALAACSLFGSAQSASLMNKLRSLTPAARNVLKRATPAAPHFVIYSDAYVATEPTVAEINVREILLQHAFANYHVAGLQCIVSAHHFSGDIRRKINGIISALSFLLTSGAADEALAWEELTASERTTILDEYNAAGISLIVSLFGSTDTPTTSGDDPITTANTMAAWALEYSLQGVDIDYEVFPDSVSIRVTEFIFERYSRTLMPSTVARDLLNSGSETSLHSSARSFLRENTFSPMLVSG